MIITVSGNTAAELRDKLAGLAKEFGLELGAVQMPLPLRDQKTTMTVPVDAVQAAAPAKRRGRKPKNPEPVAEAEDLAPEELASDDAPAAEEVAEEAAPTATRAEAEAALVELNRKKGMVIALKTLKAFGVGKLRELPEAKYGAFVAECKRASA